jgi:large subunit ribosomal protein L18
MKHGTTYIVSHRRRRESKTDYRQRLGLLRSGKNRMVVRRSNSNMVCQIVSYGRTGDKTLVTSDSKQLKKFGWKGNTGNLPAAYLTGYLCGVAAKKAKVTEAILDAGLYDSVKGSRIYACLKGALDAGLKIPHSEEILPPEERFTGKHVEKYAENLKKSDPEKYKRQFSSLLKNKIEPESLSKHFEEVKAKLKA